MKLKNVIKRIDIKDVNQIIDEIKKLNFDVEDTKEGQKINKL